MLKPVRFGLALGILWGVLLGISIIGTKVLGYPGADFYTPIAAIYFGLEVSWLGALLGTIYGFLDGFVGGTIFAWLYNLLAKD